MASLREQGVGRAWCAAAFGAHGTWGAPRAERKRKVCRQSRDWVACFEKSFGAALEADQGFQQSLAKAHPDAVCSLLQTSHLGPHLSTPPSLLSPPFGGLFKGAWGRCVHHPDGPGAPRSSHHALRTPPGHCGRGRTASRGGEPEVRGGAPGNPSRSEPGGAGAGGQEGARGGSGARGAGGRGGGRRGRPRPRLPEPAPRRRRARSLCLSPLDGGGAACAGDRADLPTAPRLTLALWETGATWSCGQPPGFGRANPGARGGGTDTAGDAGGAGREPRGSSGPDGAASPCARRAGPRGGQP